MQSILVGLLLGNCAAAPVTPLPDFAGPALDFVPSRLAESTPSELLGLARVQRPLPNTPTKSLLEPRGVPAPLLGMVEPDPRLQYGLPIWAPAPGVDYKLTIVTPPSPTAGEGAK